MGKRVCGEVKGRRGERVNMIGAWSSKKGLIAEQLLENVTVNRERFMFWVKNHLAPTLSSASVVIMDNAVWHKGDEIKEIIENTGAKLLFLPPYSPDFNPIEHYWANLKHKIRRCLDKTLSVLQKINNAIEMLQNHFIAD
ncbi:MAG: transposase [Proteobacteria bacterium]|nr:transposase [Pseudomonadota bacterium]